MASGSAHLRLVIGYKGGKCRATITSLGLW